LVLISFLSSLLPGCGDRKTVTVPPSRDAASEYAGEVVWAIDDLAGIEYRFVRILNDLHSDRSSTNLRYLDKALGDFKGVAGDVEYAAVPTDFVSDHEGFVEVLRQTEDALTEAHQVATTTTSWSPSGPWALRLDLGFSAILAFKNQVTTYLQHHGVEARWEHISDVEEIGGLPW
jgi:uncharacterized protein YceK